MKHRLDARTLGAIMTTIVFWSSAFAAIRAGLRGYAPGHVALLRFLVASGVLGVYAVATRMPLPERRDIPAIAALGFLGLTVYHVALSYGEVTVPAGTASLIIASVPVFSALLAIAFLGERLVAAGWVGIGLGFAGVALITVGRGQDVAFDPGAGLVLLSAVVSSVYVVFQKPLLRRYSAFQFTTYTIWAGTFFMLVFLPGLPKAILTAPLGATLSIVYLGIFPAALAYVMLAYAISRTPTSIITSFLYMVPVLAVLIAWAWLGEIPARLSLIGGAVALAGVFIVNRRGSRPVSEAA
jgi:drug/metabolite transporter (DMT)-like permease